MSAAPESPKESLGEGGSDGLGRKILRETSLFAMLEIGSALLAWVANIALARLLERRDFGVFGICSFYVGLGTLLGHGGLGATLLRRKAGVSDQEYRVTLTALLVVAASFSVALVVGAPFIASANHFSGTEQLVLQVMAPLYLIGALRVVPYVRLERNLSFSTIARIELYASLSRHLLALGVALTLGSVWALVASHLVGSLVQLGLAYRAAPGWVGLGWSWPVFRPLISYGVKIQGLAISSYLKDNVSRALLGGWVGPNAVGIFDFGTSYIQIPVQAVNGLARVQLPVYGKLEATDPVLRRTLRGAMRTALLVGLPLLSMLALAAPWLIPAIYGAKWAPSYPVVWGLLLNMACGLVASPLFTLLQGQGRAGLALLVFSLWTSASWLFSVVVLVIAPGGLGYLALSCSIATAVVTAFLLIWTTRHLGASALSGLGGPTFAAGGALLASALVRYGDVVALSHPLAAAALCLLIYVLLLWLLEGKLVLAEAKALIENLRNRS